MALHTQLDELIQRVLPVVQHFHSQGMFAPHAATIKSSGELSGHALTSDGTTQLSVAQTIEHFESQFAREAQADGIRAAAIFYHSPGIVPAGNGVSLPPADTTDDCKNIVAILEHASGESVYLLIPYSGEAEAIEYSVGKLIEKNPRIFLSDPSPVKKPWWKFW